MTIFAASLMDAPWFKALIYFLLAVILARVVDYLLARRDKALAVLRRTSDSAADTRYTMIRRIVFVSILLIGLAIALFQFAFFRTLAGAFLASAAILAAVVGVAARAPIANLVSGVMIAFAQPVRLGDYVSVGDVYGEIDEIRFTHTFIRTTDGRRVVIPNEVFASQTVSNFTIGSPESMVSVGFVVPVTADLEAVKAAAMETADSLGSPPDGRVNAVEVDHVDAREVTLRLLAWTDDATKRRALASDLRAALVARLRDDGVLGPAPGAKPPG